MLDRFTNTNTLEKQQKLLGCLPKVEDTQTAWLLLLYCAAARANYTTRVVAPRFCEEYSQAHDAAVFDCLCCLLGVPADAVAEEWRTVAGLPFSMGGLGLRCAERLSVAAHWASWADCLAMVKARHPDIAQEWVTKLERGGEGDEALTQVTASEGLLRGMGADLPTWQELADGQRPAPVREQEPGVFQRGWQRVASKPLDESARENVVTQLTRKEQAHLRSQSGPGAGAVFAAVPTCADLRIAPQPFRVLLLRRFRLPLPPTSRFCRCRLFLDPQGDHRAACPKAGVLGRRGFPLEAAAARVCREAGGRVRTNAFVRDMNIGAPRPDDGRRLEVLVNNLPLYNGAQLAVDTTLVCALRSNGDARPRADTVDGLALRDARRAKERVYPELCGSRARTHLVVFALEVGGRWSSEAINFVRLLARARARSEPPLLRKSAEAAWQRRWTGLLAVAAQRAFAESLLEWHGQAGSDSFALPSTQAVLEDARHVSGE